MCLRGEFKWCGTKRLYQCFGGRIGYCMSTPTSDELKTISAVVHNCYPSSEYWHSNYIHSCGQSEAAALAQQSKPVEWCPWQGSQADTQLIAVLSECHAFHGYIYYGNECNKFGSQLVLKLNSQLDSQVHSSIHRPEAWFTCPKLDSQTWSSIHMSEARFADLKLDSSLGS